MQTGFFDVAEKKYTDILAADPSNKDAALALAALTTRKGDPDGARAQARDYFERYPLSFDRNPAVAPRPLVFRVRGMDQTLPTIGKRRDGRYKHKLRGGHFSTRYLLPRSRIAQGTLTFTPAGVDPMLVPPHALLINTIAEPDVERGSLKAFERYLDIAPGSPVINPPVAVWDTARDRNYARLRTHGGVTFPRTERLTLNGATATTLARILDTMGFDRPLILRRTGTQTARSTRLIESPADLEAYAKGGISGEHYAIAYRALLWQGAYFRKLRLFWIDGALYPCVCHLDKVWNVHGGNRKTLMRNDEALMAEEKRFLADWQSYVGAPAADALEDVLRATGLDFCGIDFTLDDAGRPFIYEMNPAMRHSFDHAKNFPYKRPYDEATSEAFARMVERRAGQNAT